MPATGFTNVLRDDALYVAFDRFVCSSLSCAGSTACATGYDIDGHKLREVDARDLAEWASYEMGCLTCECGRVSKGGV